MGWQAIAHLPGEHQEFPTWTLWLAAANVVVKEALYRYKVRVATQSGSAVIMAAAWDHRSDALCSLAVLAGLAAARWGGPSFYWADEVAALVVVAVIVAGGVALFRSSASELMDVQAPSGLLDEIREVASSVEGVKGVETLWVRKSGLEYFADIHIEVHPHLTVAEGHRIGHVVKDRLLERFATLRDVLIHLEPHKAESPGSNTRRDAEDQSLRGS